MGALRRAFYDVAERYNTTIKELSFGEVYAHTHMEVSIPNAMSVSFAVQLLKGFSSREAFMDIPNHRLRYPHVNFWSAGYSNGSFGPRDETIVKNHIRRQDTSG
jgi:REP element-mobilizing transposase RayT